MKSPLMRIPYTGEFPPPTIVPSSAQTIIGAVDALYRFLRPTQIDSRASSGKTLLLTGAGISVASGLADYRGQGGTYTLNKTYRPIYYHEFVANHEARKRYWARSFLGWTNLHRARPNVAHEAIGRLAGLNLVSHVITQNVDSFHGMAHPRLPVIELHGYLRSLLCINCKQETSRAEFQSSLARLNPAWASFLEEMIATGALNSESPDERSEKGLKSNPDGDVDVPNAPYTTFRYPACQACLERAPVMSDGSLGKVEIDSDGALAASSRTGILKPAVVMFGESIPTNVKEQVERAVDGAARLLVIGSSLATYSAWRLVKRAHQQQKPIGFINLGGVRGEEEFVKNLPMRNDGSYGVRCNHDVSTVLPMVLEKISTSRRGERQGNYPLDVGMKQHIISSPLRTPS